MFVTSTCGWRNAINWTECRVWRSLWMEKRLITLDQRIDQGLGLPCNWPLWFHRCLVAFSPNQSTFFISVYINTLNNWVSTKRFLILGYWWNESKHCQYGAARVQSTFWCAWPSNDEFYSWIRHYKMCDIR